MHDANGVPEMMLTVRQVAEKLNVSDETVRTLIRNKRLRAVLVSLPSAKKKHYRIASSVVEEFCSGTSEGPTAPKTSVRLPKLRKQFLK